MIKLHRQWRIWKIALRLGLLFPSVCLIIKPWSILGAEIPQSCWIMLFQNFHTLFLFSLFFASFLYSWYCSGELIFSLFWVWRWSVWGGGFLLWKQHIFGSKVYIGSCHVQFITAIWISTNFIELFVTVCKQVRAECYDTVPKSRDSLHGILSFSTKNGLYIWKPYRNSSWLYL